MDDVLSQMSFDEGIAMPVANEENKRLEYELERKQKEALQLKEEIEVFTDRVHSMTDHLKNVRQELQQTQLLSNARKREIETEKHMRLVAEREEGRLNAEIRRIQKELEVINERKNMYENNIFKGIDTLEEMKAQMNWDQQALEAWLEESKERDENALTIQKYTRADEGKVKELSLRQEKMTDERALKRRALEHEITQTLTAQLELDKTAEAFRTAHSERQDLLSQWEATIQQMQRRDFEVDRSALKLAELKVDVRRREDTIIERQQFLDNEVANNQEKEKKISVAERQAAKFRLEYQNIENSRQQFQDELETLRYTVDRTARDLDSMRDKYALLRNEVNDKQDRLIRSKETREDLQEQLTHITDTKLSAEDRAYRLEEMLKGEELRIHDVEKELHRLREIQFRKTQELYQVKQMEANTTAEIQGARAASRNLSSKLHKLDQDSLKQQEIVYNQDFQLQTLERKIARLQGERSNEEKVLLEAKIKDLNIVLEEHNQTHNLLTNQLKNLSDDLRRANRDITKGSDEKAQLTSKIEELNLHNDSSERELKKITAEKKDLMVDENILKLQIKRLRDQLSNKADNVFSLEQRKLQLETSMQERRKEINIHIDMLKAQLKAAEEEKQTVSAELHERITKIEKLRKRYEILMVSMAPPEGEEEHSQAYYVIKAAQEKEELQRTGDELDAKIRKAEKEIRALENTLHLMNSRNETYRKSFSKVEHTSDEYEERQRLEEQLRASMDKYKYKRRQIKELQEDLQTMNNTLESLTSEEIELVDILDDKQNKVASLQKEISDQDVKKERVEKQISKYIRAVRATKKSKAELPEEKDIDLRELRDFNNSIMKQLGEVLHNHPDIAPAIHLYFTQAGLPMPPPPGPGQSSRALSTKSSRSSMSSVRSTSTMRSTPGRQSVGTARVDLGSVSIEAALSAKGSSPAGTARSYVAGSAKGSSPAGSARSSLTGSAKSSYAGSARSSVTGSARSSVAGSARSSVIGSARSSGTGSAASSVIGTTRSSATGTARSSRASSTQLSVTPVGLRPGSGESRSSGGSRLSLASSQGSIQREKDRNKQL